MNPLNWKDLIKKDMPKMGPITDETVDCTLNNASRFRGSMRVSTGRIWTDKDYDERRKRVLNAKLP